MKLLMKKLNNNVILPSRQTEGAAGYDIYMPFNPKLSTESSGSIKIPLGFAMKIPDGYVAKIYPRSSTFDKYNLSLVNTVGITDSDYIGQLFAWVKPCIESDIMILPEAGERFLQMVIVRHEVFDVEEVKELPSTKRGVGGLGSTGRY